MEKVSCGNIDVTWDPEKRLVLFITNDKEPANAVESGILAEFLARWVKDVKGPLGVLVDARGFSNPNRELRNAFRDLALKHAHTAHIAIYNANVLISISMEVFRLGTGIDMKALPSEEKARAWLRERGIEA